MGGTATECTLCNEDGKYSNIIGASNCKTSPAGFKPISETDRTGVVACPAGTYSIGGKTSCSSCLAGKYSEYDAINGAVGCTPCVLGSISSDGSSSCTPCSPPTYSDDGQTCKQCNGEGQYSDVTGPFVCKTASPGFKPTSDRAGVIPCPAGKYSLGGKTLCSTCDSNKYSTQTTNEDGGKSISTTFSLPT